MMDVQVARAVTLSTICYTEIADAAQSPSHRPEIDNTHILR